jgi:hypothetical protein
VRVLATIALGLIALVFVGTWLYGDPYSDDACLNARPPERSTFHAEAALWPPGGRCVIELPNEGERVEAGPVPWTEWTVLALGAAAALLASGAWHRFIRSPPPESNRQPLHYK